MLEWIVLGLAVIAVFALGVWWIRSADSDIKRGVERARRRRFHETGGWTRLPWERVRRGDKALDDSQ